MYLPKQKGDKMKNKKTIIWGLLISLLLIATFVDAGGVGSDPYYISGTVTDADGDAVSGATIVIERTSTGETNLVKASGVAKVENPDPGEPPKVVITTNSNGTYLFECLNLEQFADDDEFKITATKGDDTGNVKITIDIDTPPGYDDADIQFGVEEEVPAFNFGLVCPVLLFIGICLIILYLYTKRRHVGNN
jgi:hypothetical protein